jgi:hypothetical protein
MILLKLEHYHAVDQALAHAFACYRTKLVPTQIFLRARYSICGPGNHNSRVSCITRPLHRTLGDLEKVASSNPDRLAYLTV